jgi:uncharacterized membrane protein
MVAIPDTHPVANGQRASKLTAAQRWGALLAGGALTVYGITRRSPLGFALAAGGSAIALLGSLQRHHRSSPASATLLINCSPEQAYRFWRDFENLPLFMNRLEAVTVLDDRRSRWIAVGPVGRTVRWDAEITSERENEYIAWRSLPGSDVDVVGRVEFRSAPANRGTMIKADIHYTPAPGMAGAMARFLSKGANFAMRQDMRRLEALMEAGEIPTTEGQSHGRRDVVTAVMRVADPTRPIPSGATLKDSLAARRNIA